MDKTEIVLLADLNKNSWIDFYLNSLCDYTWHDVIKKFAISKLMNYFGESSKVISQFSSLVRVNKVLLSTLSEFVSLNVLWIRLSFMD
jgi:hypothetical protein